MSNVQGCTITGVAGGSDFCVLAAANCLLAEPVVHAIASAPILFALAQSLLHAILFAFDQSLVQVLVCVLPAYRSLLRLLYH